jgi:hypothetical protein
MILQTAQPSLTMVSKTDAQAAANCYLAEQIDSAFEALSGAFYEQGPLARATWRFFVHSVHGPVGLIHVDAHSGTVISLTEHEIQVCQEKAVVLAARQRGVLPLDEHGYVLSEYARRRANQYLSMDVGMFYCAADGVLIPLARPIWQFSIQVRLPQLGVVAVMGAIDIDARTGEVIPLTNRQIKRIDERTHDRLGATITSLSKQLFERSEAYHLQTQSLLP